MKKILGDNFDGSYTTPPSFVFDGKGKNIDNLVGYTSRIYHWDKNKGTLTRLTLNICDKADYQFKFGSEIRWETIKKLIVDKKFDDVRLIEKSHRYHFTWCSIIKKFYDGNKEDRFYGSIRWNGTFDYSFIENNDVFERNLKQTLYPCKWCLKKLRKLNGKFYNEKTFDIKEALKMPNELDENYQLDCEWMPNIYSQDWPKISKHIKKTRNYTCEKCGEKYPSGQLDCHHKNHLKHDNREINLQVLCKECHAKIHSHYNPH